MGDSLTVDIRAIQRLIERFDSPTLRRELNDIPQSKAIAALIAQAIGDNFDKEGPGWAPLKGSTLRKTVAKGLLRLAQHRAADQMGALKINKKTGKHSINTKRLRGSKAEFHKRTEKQLEKLERGARTAGAVQNGAEPGRRILQRTGLLKKVSTTPGLSMTNKQGVTGRNIYKVEGTNLIWGVDLIYAKAMNQGNPKKNIPARPYLVLRAEWMQRINDYMVEQVLKILLKTIRGQ